MTTRLLKRSRNSKFSSHRKASVSASATTTSKDIPKQTAFGMDDDSETELQNRYGQAFTGAQATQDKTQPSTASANTRPKYTEPPPQIPKPPARQAVLDKFGNFRLPSTEKPPEPTPMPRSRTSRSRSRSRRRYSGSRSRSRSLKRRSRSRSYQRRRSRSYRSRSRSGGSRSRSRSFSRSRSRSGSIDRRRDRRPRGRGGYDRGTYYKPRFGFGEFIHNSKCSNILISHLLQVMVAEVVDAADTEISEIIVIFATVEAVEDGWATVVAVVFVVVSDALTGAHEVVRMIAWIVSVLLNVTEVQLTMKEVRATGRVHRQQVPMLKVVGTR